MDVRDWDLKKRITLVPDQVKLEIDSNLQRNDWNNREVTVGGNSNLK